jgi:hypothetical protein
VGKIVRASNLRVEFSAGDFAHPTHLRLGTGRRVGKGAWHKCKNKQMLYRGAVPTRAAYGEAPREPSHEWST